MLRSFATLFDVDDTIVAIASAHGPALRGIVRVSGPQTLAVLAQICSDWPDDSGSWRTARTADHTLILGDESSVDVHLLVWPTEQSFTRQPACEIHTVGSIPLLEMIVAKLLEQDCRLAEPGEFTLRAFLSGRLDLTQAEAVLGVIDARNERQFDQALQQLAGGIGGPITKLRDQIIYLLAELEAGLDFAEEDIEFISKEQLLGQLGSVQSDLREVARQLQNRQLSNERVKVVFVGRPNAGKSSLFNALAGNSAVIKALVSQRAGTTRDYNLADVEFSGVPIQLVDTAGLEQESNVETADDLETKMQRLAESQLDEADLAVLCLEAGAESTEVEQRIRLAARDRLLTVRTKTDLSTAVGNDDEISTSVPESIGLELLSTAIGSLAKKLLQSEQHVEITLSRTSDSLQSAQQAVDSAVSATESGLGEEIVASELRNALDELGRVVGVIYTDDILDVVFSRFCIGK